MEENQKAAEMYEQQRECLPESNDKVVDVRFGLAKMGEIVAKKRKKAD
jgi:hypothetical protein